METLYDFLFTCGFIVASPFYFWKMWRRGDWKAGFSQRLGVFDTKIKQALTNRQILWMHAVSVGEMNVCIQIVNALQPRLPNLKIVVSTTTTTAMGMLQKKLPPEVSKIYYPIDRYKYVSRSFQTIHPDAVVLVESEIWPNFMWRARSRRTPVMLVNARLSDRSFPRYKKLGFLFRPLFQQFAAVGAQNDADAEKLRQLGCRPDRVHVVGNLKFDAAGPAGQSSTAVTELLIKFGVDENSLVLVAGSTHDGEEKILAEIFLRLQKKFPKLFLVLVPRHFERAREVSKVLEAAGVKHVRKTHIESGRAEDLSSKVCLVVDTTGELRSFYERATVTFVGKSLTAKGGQNPIEPAVLGKPVVFGPNMQNFADVTKIFTEQSAVIQVKDAVQLETCLAELLENPEKRAQLGRNAQRVAIENQGAVAETVDIIVEQLRQKDIYVQSSSTQNPK